MSAFAARSVQARQRVKGRTKGNRRRHLNLLDILAEDGTTKYLSDVIKNEVNKLPEPEATEPELPKARPFFLSERHWDFLRAYFVGARHFNPKWMRAYVGGYSAMEELAGFAGTGSEEPLDWASLRFNEAVLVFQVIVASPPYQASVMACVVLASINVGAATYPKMGDSVIIATIDLFVQVARSFRHRKFLFYF